MSLTKKVFFNTGAQVVGKVINTILGLVSVAIITRYLGVAGYGDYTTAFAYIMFFSVISDFGFFWVLVRKISVGEKIESVVQNAQSLRLIFAGIVLAAALIIVNFLPYTHELKIAIIMVATSIIWSGQNSIYLALFQSKLRMDWTVIAETSGRIISLALVFLAIYLNLNFLYIIGAGLSATLLNYILNLIFSLSYCSFGFRFEKPVVKQIFLEALPIGIVTILSLIYFKIDTVILSILRESTDVGIYGTAYKILEILMALPIMFVGTIFPALSEAYAKLDRERLTRLMQKSFDALAIGSLGITTLFFAFAHPVIGIVAGNSYLETSTITLAGRAISSDTVLQILIIAVGLNFFNSLFTNSLITFNRQKELIKPYIIATIFNVVANIIFIPRYSYVAAATTTVLTELLILILCYPMVRKLADVKLNFSTLNKSILGGIVVLVIALLGHNFTFWVTGPIALLGYIITLYASRAFTKETLKSLVGR